MHLTMAARRLRWIERLNEYLFLRRVESRHFILPRLGVMEGLHK